MNPEIHLKNSAKQLFKKQRKINTLAMVWAGRELIFFAVIGVMLCFGFRRNNVDVLHRAKDLSLLVLPCQRRGRGGMRSWEGQN